MKVYDWIVVGAGLAGSAVSYELTRVGFTVLLLDQSPQPENATRYSYGGIAYWSGTTESMRTLCEEGITLHRNLSDELERETQFRELDLLLTIDVDRDPATIASNYAACAIPPQVLNPDAAQELEPLLDRTVISGALHLLHGHVSPEAMVQAYQQAFLRLGGTIEFAAVTGLLRQNDRVQGVMTPTTTYQSNQVVIAAGGMSRALLKAAGFAVRLYFTQAEVIVTPPVDVQLRSLVMPAELKRFALEAKAGALETDALWDEPGHEVVPAILDAGAIQFRDGSCRIGQTSRTFTDPQSPPSTTTELEIRQAVGHLLPDLRDLPGQLHSCLVAFSGDRLPLIGCLPGCEGLHLFSSFSNPFAILPPLARRFAHAAQGKTDPILALFIPNRPQK